MMRPRRVLFGLVAAAAALAAIPPAAGAPTQPAFAFRGVVEGFYGTPWSHAAMADTLPWMAANGMNTFVYAPKFDPYQRAQWRDPYPADQLADLDAEIRLASRLGIAWVPNVSPGLPQAVPGTTSGTQVSRDICFSCPADRDVLYAKLDPFLRAGTRTVMVSFDDVLKVSSHPEDAAAYGTGDAAYGHMIRDLLNAVYQHYGRQYPGFRLLTVLPDYSGTTDTTHLQGVRSDGGLNRAIRVMWTGTATFNATITADQARAYGDHVGGNPLLVWDNYPVNELGTRLFLGPYQGRSADLATAADGVLANPMIEPLASRIPLATVADYLNNPAGYHPATSWANSLRSFAGNNAATTDAVAAFAQNSLMSPISLVESPVFTAREQSFLHAYDTKPFWDAPGRDFEQELDREQRAPSTINTALPAFAQETLPFLVRLAGNARTAQDALNVLRAQRPTLTTQATRHGATDTITGRATAPSPAAVAELLTVMQAAEADSLADSHITHGERAAGSGVNRNVIDAFVIKVQDRNATWTPTSALAASGVNVTVNGQSVPVAADGTFTATIPASNRPASIVATDKAGGTTGIYLGRSAVAVPQLSSNPTNSGTARSAGPGLAATGTPFAVPCLAAACLLLAALTARRRQSVEVPFQSGAR